MHEASPTFRYSADLVVIDLEASGPDEGPNEVERSNVIEIGAVRLDRKTLRVVSTFAELVKPRDYPIRPYIKELTGITPEMVASRDEFDVVAKRFVAWYGPRNRAILGSFGVYYDIPLLRKEFQAFGLSFHEHFVGGALDVRSLALAWLASHGRNTSGITVKKTLEKMGLAHLTLTSHRALDDARAAAAILQFFHLGEVNV